MRVIIAAFLLYQLAAHASEVIDLGKINVDGAARGPEIQIIGDDPIAKKALRKVIVDEISKSEPELLKELRAYGQVGTKGVRQQ